jgi:glycosyltransferase involved in cell wall biosynthesis
MSTGLGGSLFVRDAVRLDYCVEAAIESLVPVCDDVVVLDCHSTDDTLALLRTIETRHSNVRVFPNVPWEQAGNYERLMILANAARELVRARWHFMIQADEVLHESSYTALRALVAADGWGQQAFRVRRLNLYGDLDHHISLGSRLKPCSDEPTRIGLQGVPAGGDAESIVEPHGPDRRMVDRVTLFHYGFVRSGQALITKAIEMQSWFWGPHSVPDQRVVHMQQAGTGFRPYDIIPPQELSPLPMPHPAAAAGWLALAEPRGDV